MLTVPVLPFESWFRGIADERACHCAGTGLAPRSQSGIAGHDDLRVGRQARELMGSRGRLDQAIACTGFFGHDAGTAPHVMHDRRQVSTGPLLDRQRWGRSGG